MMTRQKVKSKMAMVLLLTILGSAQSFAWGMWKQEKNVTYAETVLAQSESYTGETYVNENINAHNYTYGFHPEGIGSYLEPLDTGYMRVQKCRESDVLLEYYDENYNYLSGKILPGELPIFGGFYSGTDAYYLVWGQLNEEEYDSTEVLRVVKYDKNWNRIQACSIYGANTYEPMNFAPLRMTECNGYLFLRTAHKMYQSGDDLRHQANMTIQIRESDMEMTDIADDVSSRYFGYVSHCFNTFILTDDTNHILTLDQGDGEPRGSMIGRYTKEPGEFVLADTTKDYKGLVTMEYAGEFGRNTTGATLGGFEYSDTSILVVGTSIEQNEKYAYNHTQNLYLSVTDRKELEEASGVKESATTTVRWLTDFKEDGKDFHHCATVPRLAKWNNNLFLLIWSETEYDEPTGKLYYEFIDGTGKQIGDVYKKQGEISDCQPVRKGDKMVWYITDNEDLWFYSIDKEGNFSKEKVAYPQTVDVYPKAIAECEIAATRIGNIPRDEVDTSYGFFYEGKQLVEGQDYEVVGGGGGYSSEGMIIKTRKEIQACSWNYYGRHEFELRPIGTKMCPITLTTKSKGIKVAWEKETGGLGYVIYRSENGGKKKKVAQINRSETNSWLDTKVKKGTCYSYYVKAYTKNGDKILYNNYNDVNTMMHGKKNVFKAPVIKNYKYEKGMTILTVSKNKNADGYEFQFCTSYNYDKKIIKKTQKNNIIKIKLPNDGVNARARVFKIVNGKKVYGPWNRLGFF